MRKLLISALTTMTLMTTTTDMFAATSNLLLEPSNTSYGILPFDKVKPTDYESAILAAIDNHNKEIEAITSQSAAPDFWNTIVALDRSGAQLYVISQALGNIEHAVGDTVMMNVMARMTPILTNHSNNTMLNEALFARVKKVYDSRKNISGLSSEDLRLIEETYKDFEESGAALSDADREKYRKLSTELSDLQIKFSQNLTNEMASPSRRLWLNSSQLSGLPATAIAAARAEAKDVLESEGKTDDENMYLFTVFAPSYAPFMKYQDDRELRRKMYMLYNTRCIGGEFDNTQILKDIANVRLEIANLFGYPTYADYSLRRTMAGSPQAVWDMLSELNEAYTGAMKNEIAEIAAFASEATGTDYEILPWDYSYWADKLKNARYAFNDEDMKPYFELNNTIKGVFGLANKLYGYTFKVNKSLPLYHPDVTGYEVYDANNKILGILYTDFFYRPGKAPGAWETDFRSESIDDNGVRTLPVISIVMNFSKPVGNESVLLTPSEVETFLHEFGHSLHGLSANTKYVSLSGTNVYHDFVELFSQFNENFMTQKQFLDGFAKHYKTGKKMPQELLDKFSKSSHFGAAYSCMRQLGFGYLDMSFYTITEPLRASSDIAAFEKKAQEPVKVFDLVEGCLTSPSFGHVFSGGYAAGYYGYKWSEQLDADAFAAFKENGIFDKKTAAKFHKMLQSGGTVDPMDLYVEFRGKKPTVEALLERDGIKK
jgi:peptidyl-dipeptidase Dcp